MIQLKTTFKKETLLKFSNKKIEDELENSFVNIPLPSTTIEDHCIRIPCNSF